MKSWSKVIIMNFVRIQVTFNSGGFIHSATAKLLYIQVQKKKNRTFGLKKIYLGPWCLGS